jgi:2-polyprenyl-3-methyl-5-hydroxy-6-metoxy-1,4-benzoquinol methylase
MDFGCGDSFIQDELKKEGYSVWGTDISNAVLHRLSGKSEREMFSADGFCFPMKADSVDVIIDKGNIHVTIFVFCSKAEN